MKTTLIALVAAPLALLSTPALADVSPYAKAWISEAAQEIGRTVPGGAAEGAVAVRARIGGDRSFKSVELVGSSGSRDQDEATLRSVRRYRMEIPPTELRGRTLTLRIRPVGEVVQTRAAALR